MLSGVVRSPPLLPPGTSGVNISRSPKILTNLLTIVCASLDLAEPSKANLKVPLRVAGVLGFMEGFLLVYQRSSCACIQHRTCPLFGLLNSLSQILGVDRK